MVCASGLVNHTSKIVQAPDQCLSELLLKQAETSVGCKLSVADQQEGDLDFPIQPAQNLPGQVLHDKSDCMKKCDYRY